VPTDLAERVLIAIAMDDLDASTRSCTWWSARPSWPAPAGPDAPVTVTFASDDITVMMHVSVTAADRRRVDGWVAGPAVDSLTVVDSTGARTPVEVEDGRFAIDDLPSGPTRLMLEFAERSRTFITPEVQL
jgi:hypothetical protein